jgi:hypothetical protein
MVPEETDARANALDRLRESSRVAHVPPLATISLLVHELDTGRRIVKQ